MRKSLRPYCWRAEGIALYLSVLLWSLTTAAQVRRVEGMVRDATGSVIPGARVGLRTGGVSVSGTTGANGSFVFEAVSELSGTISVQAKGFEDWRQAWRAGALSVTRLDIVLSPARQIEQIVVTATRTESRLEDVAASAVALSETDLNATPALTVDDKLRQIPGFTIFRRSSSRTANPTSQGVSLNGLGASGSSRALVLEDGVPLNDPFGGWVYWGRVPQEGLDSAEVVRGGISSLYGSNALGGVIQFLSRQPTVPAVSLETSYGSQQTPNLSLWAGERAGPWDAALAADLLHTDGYILVPVADRGSVDTAANSEHATVDLTLGRQFGVHNRVFGSGSYFTEARHNGTPLQINDTRMGQGIVGADTGSEAAGSLSLRLYGDVQGYNQSFSAIATDRMSESLTNLQHVPAQQLGGSALWQRSAGRMQNLVAGVEAEEVIGLSHENIFSSGTQTFTNIAGGRQRTVGLYGEDILRLTPRWIVTLGARLDHWRNFDADSIHAPVSPANVPTVTRFLDRSENAFSPRLSLLHQIRNNVALTASVYRAFRSPTLNELYRAFRLGNVLTEANSDLRAERLTGAEVGGNVSLLDRRLDLRGNFFWSDVVNPIANVTLSTTPALITRQRQNLGRTRARGVDFDAVARISHTVEISAGYQFVDATVVSFPVNPALQGLWVPEVPRHQFTVRARYWNPSRLMLSVQGRYSGAQFDDDINTLRLDRYFTLDVFAGRSIGYGVEVFAAVENLLNQRYAVSLTPVPTLGPPFLARVGLRFSFPTPR